MLRTKNILLFWTVSLSKMPECSTVCLCAGWKPREAAKNMQEFGDEWMLWTKAERTWTGNVMSEFNPAVLMVYGILNATALGGFF